MPEWAYIGSTLGALVIAITSLLVSASARRKNEGDAALSISQAAEKTVLMREADIKELNRKYDNLFAYVEYLRAWIEVHSKAVAKPMSFDEYMHKSTTSVTERRR